MMNMHKLIVISSLFLLVSCTHLKTIQNTEFFKVEIIKDVDGYDILNELDNVKLYKNVPKNYLHKIHKGLYVIYD